MASVTLRNLGGAVVMAVPKKILNLVRLDAGSKVDLTVEKGGLIMSPSAEPRRRPSYSPAELLAQCRPTDLKPKRSERRWLRGGAMERELL